MSVIIPQGRLDAAESVFFARELETIRAGLFEVKYGELMWRQFVPRGSEVHPADDVFSYRWSDRTGKAQLLASLGSDSPRVDVFNNEASLFMRYLGDSYGYSTDEIRKSQRSGMALPAMKARAARRAIEEKLDEIMLLGDGTQAYLGLYGLFKQASTLTYTIPNGASSGTKVWEDKTADEIVDDMHSAANKIVTNSLEAHKPDTMILPLSSYQVASNRRMGDGSNQTALSHFLETNQYINSVQSSSRLETAGGSADKRLVAYKRDPDLVEGLMSIEFDQLPPEARGYEFITYCSAKTGGVVSYWPESICYADGI